MYLEVRARYYYAVVIRKFRNSRPELFWKIAVLKIFQSFQENTGGGIQYQLKILMNVCNFTNLVLHPFLIE